MIVVDMAAIIMFGIKVKVMELSYKLHKLYHNRRVCTK